MRSRHHAKVEFLPSEESPNSEPTSVTLDFNGVESRYLCSRKSGSGVSEQVFSRNAEYSFVAQRENLIPLRVTQLGIEHDSIVHSARIGSEVFAPYNIQFFALTDVVEDRSFEIIKADQQQRETDSVAVIDFRCRIKSDRGPILTGGSLELLMNREWAPIRYEAQITYPDGLATVVGTSRFDEKSLRHGLPQRFEFHSVDPETHATLRHFTIDYMDIAEGDLQEEDARLSAWGLPEPAEFNPTYWTHRRWLVWSNLVGIVLVVVGLWVRRRVARHRPT